jgi:hypothetical protein
MQISERTQKILRETLNMNNLYDIMCRPFKDLPEDVSHGELSTYASKGRGSVRLATGRFFSPEESKNWAEKVSKLKLP